jgi:hypothetical protein
MLSFSLGVFVCCEDEVGYHTFVPLSENILDKCGVFWIVKVKVKVVDGVSSFVWGMSPNPIEDVFFDPG